MTDMELIKEMEKMPYYQLTRMGKIMIDLQEQMVKTKDWDCYDELSHQLGVLEEVIVNCYFSDYVVDELFN